MTTVSVRTPRICARRQRPILSPRKKYERIGDIPNVVFPTGAVIDSNGYLDIFYGASDSCICVGTTTIAKIIENCVESKGEY